MIFRLASYLPFWVLYRISDILFIVMYYLVRYRSEVVKDNINQAFPELTAGERKSIVRSFYRNLGDFIVEALKSISISREEIIRRVDVSQKGVIERYLGEGQSVLMMTSHQFNWEWLLFAGCLQLSAPISPIYKKLNNSYYDKLMYRTRSRFGGQPIEMQETLARIIQRKHQVNVFGMVADQIPLPDAEKYWAKFLGRDTAFFVGSEKIAQMTKYPVVFAGMKKVKRGYYQVTFQPLAEPPYNLQSHEILDRYIAKCEKLLKEQPQSWLWSHRRWKYEKPLYDQ